jgi:hypothetical protein
MMRSRSPHLLLTASAWFVLVAAVAAYIYTQGLVDKYLSELRAFEAAARDATDALDDAMAGQQAYVAIGQNARDWSPKVATYLRTATTRIEQLKSRASSPASLAPLRDASAAADSLVALDRTITADVSSDNLRAASELVFADSADSISRAVSFVDNAVTAERQAADDRMATLRRRLTTGVTVLGIALAGLIGALGLRQRDERSVTVAEPPAATGGASASDLEADAARTLTTASPPEYPGFEVAPAVTATTDVLARIAGICTDFGRVQSGDQLQPLVERAADVMQARGLIVWLGNRSGDDLRPVLAHGYSDGTLSRLAPITRQSDNATAAAYRTSEIQIVRARPNEAQGAIAVPLLASDGCIGALTAEIVEYGAEESDHVRALATILASQLAGVLATAADNAAANPNPVAQAAS